MRAPYDPRLAGPPSRYARRSGLMRYRSHRGELRLKVLVAELA